MTNWTNPLFSSKPWVTSTKKFLENVFFFKKSLTNEYCLGTRNLGEMNTVIWGGRSIYIENQAHKTEASQAQSPTLENGLQLFRPLSAVVMGNFVLEMQGTKTVSQRGHYVQAVMNFASLEMPLNPLLRIRVNEGVGLYLSHNPYLSGWTCIWWVRTSMGESAGVPNLTEENAAFIVHSLHDGLPGLYLLLSVYSRSISISVTAITLRGHPPDGVSTF